MLWIQLYFKMVHLSKQKYLFSYCSEDKKEEIWPSPMTKAPTPTESNNSNLSTNNMKCYNKD